MMVYVVVHNWQFDSGETGEQVDVFSTAKKALNYMDKLILEVRNNTPEDYVEDNGSKWCYSRYEEGEYCYNHEDITVYEREICD